MVAALISVTGEYGAECTNNAIIAESQIKTIFINITRDLYTTILIIFIAMPAITKSRKYTKLTNKQ